MKPTRKMGAPAPAGCASCGKLRISTLQKSIFCPRAGPAFYWSHERRSRARDPAVRRVRSGRDRAAAGALLGLLLALGGDRPVGRGRVVHRLPGEAARAAEAGRAQGAQPAVLSRLRRAGDAPAPRFRRPSKSFATRCAASAATPTAATAKRSTSASSRASAGWASGAARRATLSPTPTRACACAIRRRDHRAADDDWRPSSRRSSAQTRRARTPPAQPQD